VSTPVNFKANLSFGFNCLFGDKSLPSFATTVFAVDFILNVVASMDIPEATACPFVSLTISIVTLPESLPAIICASATHNTSQGCRAIKNGKLADANT